MVYVLNSFSLDMLPQGVTRVNFADVSLETARAIAKEQDLVSAVGHADTAATFSKLLGVEIPANDQTVTIPQRGGVADWVAPWHALVGQYPGPRLPEGATALPEGASIRWIAVYVE